jgi:hypothetical protein
VENFPQKWGKLLSLVESEGVLTGNTLGFGVLKRFPWHQETLW